MIEVNDRESSFTALVAGIANDAGKLIEQQLILLRREWSEEIDRARQAAIKLAAGAGLAAAGGFLLLLMLVHGLRGWTGLPLWGCFGIVGIASAGVGGLIIFFGKKEADDVQLLPPPMTAETVKENVEWLKHPTIPNSP